MSSIENVKQANYNPTMKRENLIKDNAKLSSVFIKYDKNGNGELDSDEVNKALDNLAKIQQETKKDLIKEGYDKGGIKDLKSFMYAFCDELEKDVYLNGEINFSSQGRSGDCWLLSGINALSYTDEGKNIINDWISQDESGNIAVELKGVGRKYTFSKEELLANNSSKRKASGDYDMKVLEFAFKKYRTELMDETKDNPNRNGSVYTTVGDAKRRDPLNGGDLGEAIFILTGRKNELYCKDGSIEEYKQAVAAGEVKHFFPVDISERSLALNDVAQYLDKMEKEPSRYAVECDFDKKRVKNHAYSVKSVAGDYVTVVNPWYSDEEIKIPKNAFLTSIGSFSITDMSKKTQNQSSRMSFIP